MIGFLRLPRVVEVLHAVLKWGFFLVVARFAGLVLGELLGEFARDPLLGFELFMPVLLARGLLALVSTDGIVEVVRVFNLLALATIASKIRRISVFIKLHPIDPGRF